MAGSHVSDFDITRRYATRREMLRNVEFCRSLWEGGGVVGAHWGSLRVDGRHLGIIGAHWGLLNGEKFYGLLGIIGVVQGCWERFGGSLGLIETHWGSLGLIGGHVTI